MFSEIKDQHKICHEHKNKQEKNKDYLCDLPFLQVKSVGIEWS